MTYSMKLILLTCSPESPEQIVRFYSGIWNNAQINYSTIKKEILSIVLCISKFQSDLLNQKFLLRIDCKSAKYIIEKDVENIASKQIFARWQAILSLSGLCIKRPLLPNLSLSTRLVCT